MNGAAYGIVTNRKTDEESMRGNQERNRAKTRAGNVKGDGR